MIKEALSTGGDLAAHEEISNRILNEGKVTGVRLCILFLASLIVCAGLSLNSIAAIIAAMLISQMFGSILAMAYGTVSTDSNVFKRYLVGFLLQVFVSLLASFLYFLVFPMNETTSEIVSRIKTPIYDVVIACCGGVIGILGYARKEKPSSVIYGATIAVILLPPLCICGYSLSKGEMEMFIQAAYSFGVNLYFIFSSSSFILCIMRIPRTQQLEEREWKRLRKQMVRNTVLAIVPAFIIGYFMI